MTIAIKINNCISQLLFWYIYARMNIFIENDILTYQANSNFVLTIFYLFSQ